MTPALRQFLQNLADSQLLPAGEIKVLLDCCSSGQGEPYDAIKKQLLESKTATPFQLAWLENPTRIPLVLGDYVLLEPLGRGGMGQVFRARHRTMDRLVAIKALPDDAFESPDAIARFKREVRAAAKLSHPHIVRAYDAREFNHVQFLVMELVEGRDLASLLALRGPLPLHEVTRWLAQAAEAMTYAHSRGVIHRDLKPSNLLINREGRLQVLDLGLARFASEDSSVAPTDDPVTEAGRAMGTLDYMAPEQAEDARHADERSDIYSLGCTLFRLLTGQLPYEATTKVKKILAHREQPVPSICALRPDAIPEIDCIFQSMVAKRPEDRYASMHEVAKELHTIALRTEETKRSSLETSAPWVLPLTPPPIVARPSTNPELAPSIPKIDLGSTRPSTFRLQRSVLARRLLVIAMAGVACLALGISGLFWAFSGQGKETLASGTALSTLSDTSGTNISQPHESLPRPRLTPDLTFQQAELHERLAQLLDAQEHQDELRSLYTEIATCVDQSRPGRWLIGAGNTSDRQAWRFSARDGDVQYERLTPAIVAEQQLRPDEIRHLLPPGWLPPKDEHLTLTPLRSEVTTYTDGRKDVLFVCSYTGQVPADALQLMAHLKVRAIGDAGDINSVVEFDDLILPASPCELTFELPPEASLEHGAKLYVMAYLTTPDARYFRISNVVPVTLAKFDVALGHDADMADIREKLTTICRNDSEQFIVPLAAEVAAAIQSQQKVQWVVRSDTTRDNQPWEILTEGGKWLSQRAIQHGAEGVSSRAVSRVGDPLARLEERPMFLLSDVNLKADQDLPNQPWQLLGTLDFKLQRAEPVEHMMLVYRVPAGDSSRLQNIDTYYVFPNADALPMGELNINLTLPAEVRPSNGGELFLMGFVQNDAKLQQVFQLSNRIAWPKAE